MYRTFRPIVTLVALVLGTVSFSAVATAQADPTAPAAASPTSLCTCYYTYDEECPKGFVCDQDWDPIACVRMKPKGGAYAGKCTEKDEQKKVRPCDATCSEKTPSDSVCAGQDIALIGQAMDLWRQAITAPALSGGGRMDPALVEEARAVPLNTACADYVGWRTFAVLELCRGHESTDHTDPVHDELTDHLIADLSGDRCRIEAGDLCIDAVLRGMAEGPPAVAATLSQVPLACPDGVPFESPGPGYEDTDPLDAVADRLRVTVEYLTALPAPLATGAVL